MSSQGARHVPITKRVCYGDQAFSKFAPGVWNELPLGICLALTLDTCKTLFKYANHTVLVFCFIIIATYSYFYHIHFSTMCLNARHPRHMPEQVLVLQLHCSLGETPPGGVLTHKGLLGMCPPFDPLFQQFYSQIDPYFSIGYSHFDPYFC